MHYYITNRAFRDIDNIYESSLEYWGKKTAKEYINNLYKDINKILNNPEVGKLRNYRSYPFLMYPSGKHFIVYDKFQKGIIILKLFHQMQDIERIISDLEPLLLFEMQEFKRAITN